MCIEVWPDFKEIIKKQVKPVPDPTTPGNYLNLDEFMAAPTMGHFHLPLSTETKIPFAVQKLYTQNNPKHQNSP